MSGANPRHRSVRRIAPIRATSPGRGFDRAASLNAAAVDADLTPFVDLTLFEMSEPVFRPHPHAGFSAVTYMLESSPGSFRNRWTAGPDELIGPGALHWTRAGSGMLHEEVPTTPGVVCRGLQMFVKLPAERELDPPQAFHLDAHEIPEVRPVHGARVRVLAGEFDGVAAPLGLPDALVLLDVGLDPGAHVELPAEPSWNAFAFVLAGEVHVDAVPVPAEAGIVFADDGESVAVGAGDTSAHLLFGAGPPLEGFSARGPFVLSSGERHDEAERRYRAGDMGHLAPSF